MKKNINNEKGFTLIELLAVIVVLAIVSVVAVNAVMPRLDEGRRQSFATEANVAIDSANAYFMSQSVLGSGKGLPAKGKSACVSIDDLIDGNYYDADKGVYEGKVQVTQTDSGLFLYKVWLRNNSLMVVEKGSTANNNKNVTVEDVEDYNSGSFGNNFKTCSATPTA